jgi:hypothetical protein
MASYPTRSTYICDSLRDRNKIPRPAICFQVDHANNHHPEFPKSAGDARCWKQDGGRQTGSTCMSRSRLDRHAVPTALPMLSGSPGLVDSALTFADINRRRKLKTAASKPEVVIYRVLGKIETRFRWLNLRCYTKTALQSQVVRFRVFPPVKRNYFRFVSRHLVSGVSRCQRMSAETGGYFCS